MPEVRAPRTLRLAAVAALVTQIVIVVTGGAVRLTGSGLGCDTWPNCTAGSLTPVPESGVHGLIEFGNRLMGIVVGLVAIWLVVSAILYFRRSRNRTPLVLAGAILFLTLLQGFIGGVVVWLRLRPDTVGIHFVISVLLVCVATVEVWRVFEPAPGARLGSKLQRILTHCASAVFVIVILFGILTTGSGPHAGDHGAARNGLDSELLQHIHSLPAYLLFALTLALLMLAVQAGPRRTMVFLLILLGIELLQIAVGIWQANAGLPILLVGVHLALSVLAASALTSVVLSMRAPTAATVRS